MISRNNRYASWAATFSGVAAILGLVSLLLFFGLESSADAAQKPHLWGPISDICPILQMASLLVVAHSLYRMEQSRAQGMRLISSAIGVIGMLGVVLLQLLLIVKVITFEQEVGPVLLATGAVGVWLILANLLGWQGRNLPARHAWLGMAVGAAFALEPVMLSAAGGAVAWRVFMSNILLLTASAVVFLVAYVGFPVWAFWLGRLFLKTN